MAKLEELKKYLTHEFSSGSYTGNDYKTFQYCFSAFIKSSENKCVYLSISDVRYFTNEWYGHILIRTAKDEQDYRGGFNYYTTLEALPVKAAELLDDLPF